MAAGTIVHEWSGPGTGGGFPVADELAELLPGGRLRPGTAVSVDGDLPLLLALATRAAAEAGAWAVIGLPELGVLAAESMGLDVGVGIFVDAPGKRWPDVLATLAESVPVLLLGALGPATGRTARRLGALLRRHRAVLLTCGAWEGAEVRLSVTASRWEGVDAGHGLLRRRWVRLVASGRGAAGGAPRVTELWLPGADGQLAPALDPGLDPALDLDRALYPALDLDRALDRALDPGGVDRGAAAETAVGVPLRVVG